MGKGWNKLQMVPQYQNLQNNLISCSIVPYCTNQIGKTCWPWLPDNQLFIISSCTLAANSSCNNFTTVGIWIFILPEGQTTKGLMRSCSSIGPLLSFKSSKEVIEIPTSQGFI
jgi:hypothetical protein